MQDSCVFLSRKDKTHYLLKMDRQSEKTATPTKRQKKDVLVNFIFSFIESYSRFLNFVNPLLNELTAVRKK